MGLIHFTRDLIQDWRASVRELTREEQFDLFRDAMLARDVDKLQSVMTIYRATVDDHPEYHERTISQVRRKLSQHPEFGALALVVVASSVDPDARFHKALMDATVAELAQFKPDQNIFTCTAMARLITEGYYSPGGFEKALLKDYADTLNAMSRREGHHILLMAAAQIYAAVTPGSLEHAETVIMALKSARQEQAFHGATPKAVECHEFAQAQLTRILEIPGLAPSLTTTLELCLIDAMTLGEALLPAASRDMSPV